MAKPVPFLAVLQAVSGPAVARKTLTVVPWFAEDSLNELQWLGFKNSTGSASLRTEHVHFERRSKLPVLVLSLVAPLAASRASASLPFLDLPLPFYCLLTAFSLPVLGVLQVAVGGLACRRVDWRAARPDRAPVPAA